MSGTNSAASRAPTEECIIIALDPGSLGTCVPPLPVCFPDLGQSDQAIKMSVNEVLLLMN